jgi:hypothetical protein
VFALEVFMVCFRVHSVTLGFSEGRTVLSVEMNLTASTIMNRERTPRMSF